MYISFKAKYPTFFALPSQKHCVIVLFFVLLLYCNPLAWGLDQKLVLRVWNVNLSVLLAGVYPVHWPLCFSLLIYIIICFWIAQKRTTMCHFKNNCLICVQCFNHLTVWIDPRSWRMIQTKLILPTFIVLKIIFVVFKPISLNSCPHLPPPSFIVLRQHCQYNISSAWGLQSRQRPGVLQSGASGGRRWWASSEQHCYILPQGLCVSEEHQGAF